MRRTVVSLLALLMAGCLVFSCTSFVFNGEEKVRGMNFDFTRDVELSLHFTDEGEVDAFYMAFNRYAVTFGVNTAGVFTTLQGIDDRSSREYESEHYSFPEAFLTCLTNYGNVSDFRQFVEDKNVVFPSMMFVHMLASDSQGNGFILELSEAGNEITQMQGERFVMTNFPVHRFAGKKHGDVEGSGADRYKNTYEALNGIEQIEDYREGFDILGVSRTEYTGFSAIFFPERDCVYFSFNGNFKKVWKLDLEERTIKTEKGFESEREITLSAEGITRAALLEW